MLNLLHAKITNEFPEWNKYALKNILILTLGILEKESSCLNKIKTIIGKITGNTTTKVSSHYKMLLRIFTTYSYSRLWVDLLLYSSKLARKKSEYLLLDGTSWEQGNLKTHFMTLACLYDGVALPIFFQNLHKKGISNQKERIKLFKRAGRFFNLKGKTLLADREYVGSEWFSYLTDNEINFIIRCKMKTYQKQINELTGFSYDQIISHLVKSKKKDKVTSKIITIDGRKYQLVFMKNPKPNATEPIIIMITNLLTCPKKISEKYILRWKIECCFKHMKSNGFKLEEMNVKGHEKRLLFMSIIVFAYSISIHQGLKKYDAVRTKIYNDEKEYKEVSLFRFGYEMLTQLVDKLDLFIEYLMNTFHTNLPSYRSSKSIYVQ